MRWIIFIGIYIFLGFYGFQAFRTISRNPWLAYIYASFCLAALINLFYQFNFSGIRGISGAKGYAIGFLLCFLVPNLLIFLLLFAEDFIRVIVGGYRKFNYSYDAFTLPGRRKFLSQIALGLAAVPFFSLIYGMVQGRYNFRVIKHTLFFDDLPDAFDGYKITQVSDIHSGSFDNHEKVEYAVDLINEQPGDVIFFTGDLVNNIASEMDSWKTTFSKIKAKDGVFSILGNHDYGDYVSWETEEAKAANLKAVKQIHAEMGWDLLLNEQRILEKDGEKIAIVGVENWGTGRFIKKGDVDKAGQGLKKEDFKILLSHDPSYWQAKIKTDPQHYQLTLSGHTHGMQFGIDIPGFKWSPIQYRYKNWAGVYEEFGRYINVNRGFGTLAYPGRVGIWPEITLIELRKMSKTA